VYERACVYVCERVCLCASLQQRGLSMCMCVRVYICVCLDAAT